MIPTIPTRTDAFVLCPCSGTATISTVAPIADDPDRMRHLYTCLDCGKELTFDVDKKAKEPAQESAPQVQDDKDPD
ncbi:MAG: hypothetical protein Q7T81_13815 [Pseudolabrys sp.]|nr:hypothetical protein [Pseudolabrys sp.]